MPTLPVKPKSVPNGAKPPEGKTLAPLLPDQPADRSPKWETAVMAAIALFLMTACWFVPRPTGDLYVAFAGARDLMDGKLGKPKGLAGPGTAVTPSSSAAPLVRLLGLFGVHTGGPDDWSFDEPRPVWVDQNWGTQLLFDIAYKVFGKNGVPGLKALLMLTMAASIALACRQHKVRWPVCLLMGGCAVLGGNAYIDLRPNLILLTLAPMMYWLLVRSRHSPARIWWALLLLLFWGNMHGSAILGLAMLCLWAVCQGLPAAIREEEDLAARLKWFCILGFFSLLPVAALMGALLLKWDVGERLGEPWYWIPFLLPLAGLYLVRHAPPAIRKGFRRWRLVLLAPVIGMMLITLVTLFGLENLTHPLIMARVEAWRGVQEWRPVLPLEPVSYGSTTEFFIAMGLLALLMAARPLIGELLGQRRNWLGDGLRLVFSLTVSALVAVLAWENSSILGPRVRRLELSGGRDPGYVHDMQELLLKANVVTYAFAFVAVLGLYAAYRVFLAPTERKRQAAPAERTEGSLLFFAVILSGVVLLAMAFESRRFVTLALGLVAPLLGAHLDWLFRQARRVRFFEFARPAVLAGVAVLPFAGGLLARLLPVYDPQNPRFMPQLNTVFDRMTDTQAYIHGGADFLHDNQIRGNMIEEWRWEGFLHWKCPQMKIYVGGRAQQAYDVRPYEHRMELWDGYGYLRAKMFAAEAKRTRQPDLERRYFAEMATAARTLENELQRMKISFVVGALDTSADSILEPLYYGTNHRWVYLYYDRQNFILADSADPQVQAVIDKIVSGEAIFPDYIPGLAASCKAMLMTSLPQRYDRDQRRDALEQACRETPSMEFYGRLRQMEDQNELPPGEYPRFAREEFYRLEKVHSSPYEDLYALRVRFELALSMLDQSAREAGWPGPDRVSLEQWMAGALSQSPQKAKDVTEWYGQFLGVQDKLRDASKTLR